MLLSGTAAPAWAQEPVLRKGQQEIDLSLGYATDLDIDKNRDRVSFYTAVPRYGRFLSPRRELLLEVPLTYYFQPEHAGSIGIGVTYRQHIARLGRLLPFVEVGAGGVVENLDLRDLDGELQFQLHAGLGLRYLLNNQSSFTLSARLHHLSNGGLGGDNRGMNNALVLVGYSRFLK